MSILIATKWLYNKNFELTFKNIGKDLWEDLRQEVALIVCEYDQDKLRDIVEKGEQVFKFWIVRICCNQTNTKYGAFGKMYSNLIPVEDINIFIKEERPDYDDSNLIKEISKKINELYWYDREILKMYIEKGSVRKVAQEIGIPHTSIFITIKKIQAWVKSSLDY